MKILEKLLLVKEIITRLVDSYFKDHYKMIAIDLSKQQAVDDNLRAIQQINFTANSDREEIGPEETVLDFSEGTVKVL